MAIGGDAQFEGALLSIAPGTTFIMGADSSLEIGVDTRTTVMALGTEQRPIRFCPASSATGQWKGVRIGRDVSSDSVFEHVQIRGAGAAGAALALQAGIRLTDVSIHGSVGDGVRAELFARGSARLNVLNSAGAPVVLTAPAAFNELPLGGHFEGNADNVVRVRFSERITTAVTVHDPGIPYVQEGEVDVDDIEITFEAGVDYRFAADGRLVFGFSGEATELHVAGTAEAPVVFQGAEPTKGYWQGLEIQRAVNIASTLSHMRVLHAGGLEHPSLRIASELSVSDLTLEDNLIGLHLASPLQPDSARLTIAGTEGPPLVVLDSEALTRIPEGSSFLGNAEDVIVVANDSIHCAAQGTVHAFGVPYLLTRELSLSKQARVTIEPGAQFIVGGDVSFVVGSGGDPATLIAVGTQAKPIVFRGERDLPGYWEEIEVLTQVGDDTRIDHVEIRNAGKANSAALRLRKSISVTNTMIAHSAGAGIMRPAEAARDYSATNTFVDVAGGDVVDP